MSKTRIEKVTCPDCNYVGEYKVYDSINIDNEAENISNFKEKVIDNSIFLYTCKNCGSKFYIEYPFLYNDMKNNFMVWCIPENFTEAEINNIKNVDMRKYEGTLRIATGKYNFLDKLNIFENKLSDIVIESIKTFLFSKLKKEEQINVKQIIFNGINIKNKTLDFVFISKNDTSKMLSISSEFYGEIKNNIKEKKIKGFEIINQENFYNYIEND